MKSNLYLTLHNLYISSHILHTVLDIYPKSWQWEFVMKSRAPWVRDHFLILMTLMFDSRVILYGEIRCYSFLGVRGLRKVWIHEVSPFLGTHNLPLEWIKARFSQQVDQLLPWKSAGVDERVFRFVTDRFVSALKAVILFSSVGERKEKVCKVYAQQGAEADHGCSTMNRPGVLPLPSGWDSGLCYPPSPSLLAHHQVHRVRR